MVLVLSTLQGCSTFDSSVNVPPMRRYTEKLVKASGTRLTVDRCGMFDASRKGFCVLEGSAADIAAFTTGIKLAPKPAGHVHGDLSCLALGDFGVKDGTARVAKPSVGQFSATAPLPPNSDNVHLVSVYAGATSVCVEMEYPYG